MMSCASMMESARGSQDVTAPWRDAYSRQTVEQSGFCPPGMDLTFVLLFYCDLLATPAAYAAALGPWVLDVSPAAVSFDLADPWTHPGRVQLRRGGFRVEQDAVTRREAARAAYEQHAVEFARLYAPGERLSSHQRLGLAADCWDLAWAQASGLPAPGRRGCCLIYALPGAHECAGCPRVTGVS